MDDDESSSVWPKNRSVIMMCAGGLFAVGWFLLIDAMVMQASRNLKPSMGARHVLPGLVATIGFVMIVCTPRTAFADGLYGATHNSCAQTWLFIAFIVIMSSLSMAGWMSVSTFLQVSPQSSVPNVVAERGNSEWPGVALILQALAIISAAMLVVNVRMMALASEQF